MRDAMRVKALALASLLAIWFGTYGCAKLESPAQALSGDVKHGPAAAHATRTAQTKVDFDTQIRPLLESRCTPCHFSGGKMYERLPFDRAETIKRLGTKLFTRLRDENEQRLIREFLSQ